MVVEWLNTCRQVDSLLTTVVVGVQCEPHVAVRVDECSLLILALGKAHASGSVVHHILPMTYIDVSYMGLLRPKSGCGLFSLVADT
jgi:hypothetical protein